MGNTNYPLQSNSVNENCSITNAVPVEIQEHILSYVEPKQLLRECVLVNKDWNSLIKQRCLWMKMATRQRLIVPVQLEHSLFDLQKICMFNPYGKNLLKNPNGEEKLKHWRILLNGGDHWKVEKKPHYCDSFSSFGGKSCFATSFDPCAKVQIIDLQEEGFVLASLNKHKFPIHISEWYAARGDCGSEYKLEVCLMDEKKDEWYPLVNKEIHERTEQWQGGDWKKVSFVFEDYPEGVRFVRFFHYGVDTQFWKGHYGAKMAGGEVFVLPHDTAASADPVQA